MNLLFDFITVRIKTGAGEYHRRIFFELLRKIEAESLDVDVFALWDSRFGIAYDDLTCTSLSKRVTFFDVKEGNVSKIIDENKIDCFFIACGQYLGEYDDIVNVKCRVICTIHDMAYEELSENKIYQYLQLINPGSDLPAAHSWKGVLYEEITRHKHDRFEQWYHNYGKYAGVSSRVKCKRIIELAKSNPQVRLITVSSYTKDSLVYNYNTPPSRVTILYSPERITATSCIIENDVLRGVVEQKKSYFLMVSAGASPHKNPHKVLSAFRHFSEMYPNFYLVTIGYRDSLFSNHIDLEFLSDSDLTSAYAHCYALIYPSFFEGFGYPPLEAMRLGKPVLASNTTSIPEVLGDAAIYFSPLYESAIFHALRLILEADYMELSHRVKQHYAYIRLRQEKDLMTLLNMLVLNS